jgi:hypothetical protein
MDNIQFISGFPNFYYVSEISFEKSFTTVAAALQTAFSQSEL